MTRANICRWLEFHPYHQLSGWKSNYVVGNPPCNNWIKKVGCRALFQFYRKHPNKKEILHLINPKALIFGVVQNRYVLSKAFKFEFPWLCGWISNHQKGQKFGYLPLHQTNINYFFLNNPQFQGNMNRIQWVKGRKIEYLNWKSALPKTEFGCLM